MQKRNADSGIFNGFNGLDGFDGPAFQSALEAAIITAFGQGLLDPVQVKRLTAFGTWLAEASGSVNLTRILDPEGMAVRHFLDTFQLIPLLEGIPGPVLDVGTGGGIPGIPLAIFRPDLEVVMIDGTAKKIVYVREWAKALGLEKALAHHARAEVHLKTFRYEALISRAAVKSATMMEILIATGPCVKNLIFMEGAKGKETARNIAPLARRAGYALAAITPYRLPGLDKERYLVTFSRGKKPPRRR